MRQLQTNLRPRRPGFVLTPLIDVIFLLVKFFMLTSLIASYGLLPVSSAGGGPPAAGGAVPAAAAKPVTLRISHGLISAGKQTIAIGELPGAIDAMKAAGATGVMLLTSRSATVQDVVSVLEAFKAASFPNVTLVSRSGG